MPGLVERTAFRRNVLPDGRPLTKEQREKLVKPYLPAPRPDRPDSTRPSPSSGHDSRFNGYAEAYPRRWQRPSIRALLASTLHKIIFLAIQLIFTIYIYARQLYHAIVDRSFSILYYHHRTPELIRRDIKNLRRLPKHLSIIVDYKTDGTPNNSEELSKLIEDVAEVAAWCTCVGIPLLSVYERTGVLKQNIPSLHKSTTKTLRAYFPPHAPPYLHIRAPHRPAYSPPSSPHPENDGTTNRPSINLLLMSSSDGRDTLVDLTKTLVEMAQRGKLAPQDITADLIDAEVTESSCGEPDVLVLMAASSYKGGRSQRKRGRSHDVDVELVREGGGAGGDVCLRGYPPWQVRLTEIFHVQDNAGVEYQVFLRALHRYAKAEMRLGR